jgi:sulfotransferase
MERFHTIGGLPRSGSTLLVNILNQNPRFAASSTSCVAQTVSQTAAYVSAQDEMRSELARDKEGTERRFVALLRGMIEGWYAETDAPVVFDKSRAWNGGASVLRQLYPDARLIVVVRDLRDIFASIEKQDQKNPVLSMVANNHDRALMQKATNMFAPKGMIGAPLCGIEDVLRRKPSNVSLIKYEFLVANPDMVFKNLYNELGEEWFDHDFDNVESTATELDALWLNKYPHDGSGKVQAPDSKWSDWVSPDVATVIMRQFPGYNGAFGYV